MSDLKSAAATRDGACFALRLALGAIFVQHGAAKLGLLDPARGWDTMVASVNAFAGTLSNLGVEPAGPLAWTAALVEFFGGAFLVLGFATRFAAAATIPLMVVAIAKVHARVGFASTPRMSGGHDLGYELNVILIAAALALVLLGSGALGLDPMLARLHKSEER